MKQCLNADVKCSRVPRQGSTRFVLKPLFCSKLFHPYRAYSDAFGSNVIITPLSSK
jgi:hypothetical protein